MALDDHFASIQVWLATEEQATAHHDVFALTERLERRNAIRTHLAHLLADIERAAARLDRLPALPELSCLRWAHSVFAYPNGRILVVDSLFPAESAVLVQVLVLDFAGQVRLHRCVTPGDTLSQADRTRLGISVQELQEARSLPPIWPELLAALHGCYLLAADLRQTRLVLEQEAQRFGLEPPVCIGDDLLTWAIRWYQQSGRTSLSSLCELIGHPLPPDASITVRARGQLALLKAMARGRDQGEDDPHSPQARALEENRDDAQ